jgi:S-adenosylmethionine-diacylgycerolhomoserine-N-methlytransferase
MAAMYRHQRHVYDLTRKFFLFGRDRLIARLEVAAGDRVCEIGCGTARNLLALARRHPTARFFGLDASAPMLETAHRAIARAGLGDRIRLAHGLAEELDHHAMFGLAEPFDRVVFAYSLSMIPRWREALAQAAANLRPGGSLAIVDFGDQRGLPAGFARSLQAFLARFDVHPRRDLAGHLPPDITDVSTTPLFGNYAITVTGRKA